MNSSLSISGLFKDAWVVFKTNWKFLVQVTLLVGAITLIFSLLRGFLAQSTLLSFVVAIVDVLFSLVLTIGTLNIAIRLVYNKPVSFKDLWQRYDLLWKMIGAQIVSGVVTILPLVIFILVSMLAAPYLLSINQTISFALAAVVGLLVLAWMVFWLTRLIFVTYLVVDKEIGPIMAFRESLSITKSSFWSLLLLFITISVVNVLGTLALMIGLLVTVPLTLLVTALAYSKLVNNMLPTDHVEQKPEVVSDEANID